MRHCGQPEAEETRLAGSAGAWGWTSDDAHQSHTRRGLALHRVYRLRGRPA